MSIDKAEFKGQLAGMLLGDAGVFKSGGKNAYLTIQHTEKQKEYLLYKKAILENLTAVTMNEYKGGTYKKNPNTNYRIKTRRHPLYTRIRDIAYKNNRKQVNRTWLSWLTNEGLAFWYMDDGSLSKSRSYNKSGKYRIASRRIYLNTCDFSLEENELLCDFVEKRFGIKFYPNKAGEYQGRVYYRLVAGAQQANRFFDIIRPFIIPSMEYKLDMEYQ